MNEHLIQRFLASDPSLTPLQRSRLSGGEDAVLGMMSYVAGTLDASWREAGWLWADALIRDQAIAIDPTTPYTPAADHRVSPLAHMAALLAGYVSDMDRGRPDPWRIADGMQRTYAAFSDEDLALAYDTDELVRSVTLWVLPRAHGALGFGARMLPMLHTILAWQRLMWLAECRAADAVVVGPGEYVAWPADPSERLAWLWALTAAQPELRRAPALFRAVIEEPAPRLLASRTDIEQLVQALPAPPDGVVDQAVHEAAQRMRAHPSGQMARGDLGGLWGISRVLVAAERPVDAGAWRLAFALEHAAGWLAGEIYCGGSGQWLVESCQLSAAGDAVSGGAADGLALLVLDTFLGAD